MDCDSCSFLISRPWRENPYIYRRTHFISVHSKKQKQKKIKNRLFFDQSLSLPSWFSSLYFTIRNCIELSIRKLKLSHGKSTSAQGRCQRRISWPWTHSSQWAPKRPLMNFAAQWPSFPLAHFVAKTPSDTDAFWLQGGPVELGGGDPLFFKDRARHGYMSYIVETGSLVTQCLDLVFRNG